MCVRFISKARSEIPVLLQLCGTCPWQAAVTKQVKPGPAGVRVLLGEVMRPPGGPLMAGLSSL